jgi:hypothetical protein
MEIAVAEAVAVLSAAIQVGLAVLAPLVLLAFFAAWRIGSALHAVADAIDGVSHAQRQDTYARAKLHGFLADEATKRAGNP